MFEFNKLCGECEKLSSLDRKLLLTEKSIKVLAGLNALEIPDISPVKTLAAFIIGSAVTDGVFNEKDYLYIYPSLVNAFGSDFDFHTIKQSLKLAKDVKKEIQRYTKDLCGIIGCIDEELQTDIISLCLLVTSIDGKISLKEKRYIKQLCKS